MMSQPQVVQLAKGRAYQDISSAIAAKYNRPVDVLYQLLGHVAAYVLSGHVQLFPFLQVADGIHQVL